MWQRTSPTIRWGLVVLIGALLLAVLNVWWFETYRRGFPFDIDEAGYTVFGIVDYLGLRDGGPRGWWEAIVNQPTFAPLVPALTSLTVWIHPGVMNGFAVLTAFLVVLAIAAYGVAERLAGPRLGALAALVTATLPGTFAFAREYVFALPVAALLMISVFALLRSDGLRQRRWAIACGVAIGLMLLTRTMAITYVPGILLAAVVVALAREQGDLAKRFVNFVFLVVAAIAVAATWYTKNLGSVVEYLTDYGYGKQSEFYGRDSSMISWERLRSVAERMVSEDLFLPLAVLLGAALVALAVAVVRRLRPQEGRRREFAHLARTDALSIALVLAVGYAGLMSSQNGGNGFTLPLAALLPPLAVLALRQWPAIVKPAVAFLALIVAVNVVSTSTIWSTASHTRLVSVPGFVEEFPVTKGMPKAVFAIRAQVSGPETIFDGRDSRWLEADRRVADALAEVQAPNGAPPLIGFASRHRALNTNTVQLASIVKHQRGLPLLQLVAEPTDSVAEYVDQLNDPKLGKASALVTTNRTQDDFPPAITQSYAEKAAKKLRLSKIRTFVLPDGRRLYLWLRTAPETSKGPPAR
jgi:4-amino-4-deoxy-L-arabinose transferase-like glycosyltransferase